MSVTSGTDVLTRLQRGQTTKQAAHLVMDELDKQYSKFKSLASEVESLASAVRSAAQISKSVDLLSRDIELGRIKQKNRIHQTGIIKQMTLQWTHSLPRPHIRRITTRRIRLLMGRIGKKLYGLVNRMINSIAKTRYNESYKTRFNKSRNRIASGY